MSRYVVEKLHYEVDPIVTPKKNEKKKLDPICTPSVLKLIYNLIKKSPSYVFIVNLFEIELLKYFDFLK